MMSSSIPSYTVDARCSVAGAEVEVHTYSQPEPFNAVIEITAHTLSMSLTPRVSYSRCCYLDDQGRQGPWVEAGDVIFSPQGMKLMVLGYGDKEPYRRVRCSFSSSVFKETTGLWGNWTLQQLTASLNVQATMIKRDLYRIVKEVSESASGRECVIEATARILMVDLSRYLLWASRPAESMGVLLADWQMRRITDYVDGMIDLSPNIAQLARLCEISPRHLTRSFRGTTGKTIGDYVRDVRMVKARSLLADTDLSLKEIAYRLGFANPSSFSTAFGKAVGTTPKQFRMQHREGRMDQPGSVCR